MQRSTKRIALTLAVAALLAGCGGEPTDGQAASSSPSSTLERMLALAQAGDWETYVRTYYGEQAKFTKPDEQIPQVAQRLAKAGPKLIEMMKACVGQEPAMSEDGSVATWPNQLRLHKDGGKWGFHL